MPYSFLIRIRRTRRPIATLNIRNFFSGPGLGYFVLNAFQSHFQAGPAPMAASLV